MAIILRLNFQENIHRVEIGSLFLKEGWGDLHSGVLFCKGETVLLFPPIADIDR